MPLFFKKKDSAPDGSPEKKKNTVTLSCPECSHNQSESRMAVSTYCRGCGSHYKIENGKAVAPVRNPSNPYARSDHGDSNRRIRSSVPKDTAQDNQPTHGDTAKNPITPTSTDSSPVKQSHSSDAPSARARAVPPTSKLVKSAAASTGFFQSKVPPREVACFECDKVHKAPAESSSTLCPACGAYIALKDYDIRENWNRRIQTRGNVTIHKKATVTGITIRCHHLVVHGALTGGVDCSGDFTLRSHGKIMGKVSCKRLIIEKRAKVEFSNPVECEDAIIDGEVVGHFTCKGKLHLKKKATLTGDIKVATMAIDEGARHHGRMSIGQ